jgi:hypothetical protein
MRSACDGLTADDDHRVLLEKVSGGPDDVLELDPSHAADRVARMMAMRSSSLSRPANGDAWRRSTDSGSVEVRMWRSVSIGPSSSSCHRLR